MLLKSMIKFSFVLLLAVISSSFKTKFISTKYSISIKITNIRNNKGMMQLQLYLSQETFQAEKPFKIYRISKKDASSHTLHYKIEGLLPNIYGIALLDDENSNKKMDYAWFYPKEGFGFSDYYHTAWSKPTFHKFKFNLKADKAVNIKIRYI